MANIEDKYLGNSDQYFRVSLVLSLHTDGLGSPKSCLMGVGATGAWLLVHASCEEPTLSVPTSPPVVVTATRSW